MEDKTYTVYTHRVVTEDNGPMYYIGVTCLKLQDRWYPRLYKDTSLWPYIEKYSWDNIEHSVFAEGLDRETAYRLEDTLIQLHRHFDSCINYQRSGLIQALDKRAYQNQWRRERYASDSEYAEHTLKRYRDKYKNNPEFAERRRQRERDRGSTPEGKIYKRVQNFNRSHPDRIVETPLEARDNYLATGYIPPYIKHDDL